MKNRNLFLFLVILCVLAPGIYYFISGKNYDHSVWRNVLVGVQILGGIALIVLFGMKKEK